MKFHQVNSPLTTRHRLVLIESSHGLHYKGATTFPYFLSFTLFSSFPLWERELSPSVDTKLQHLAKPCQSLQISRGKPKAPDLRFYPRIGRFLRFVYRIVEVVLFAILAYIDTSFDLATKSYIIDFILPFQRNYIIKNLCIDTQ